MDKIDETNVTSSRSQNFTKEEVNVLLDLIQKFRNILLNTATTSAINHKKEDAWIKIAEEFNENPCSVKRTPESLKIKWTNLKKKVKKVTNNIIEADNHEIDKVVTIIFGTDKSSDNETLSLSNNESMDVLKKESKPVEHRNSFNGNSHINNDDDDENDINDHDEDADRDDDDDDDVHMGQRNRSSNFSTEENKRLIECVKVEKDFVLSKDISSIGIKLKNIAWNRIGRAFNRDSVQKRSVKVLKTRFFNMKNIARKTKFKNYLKDIKKKHKKFENECAKDVVPVKKEPESSDLNKEEVDYFQDDGFTDHNELEPYPVHSTSDPLSTVLNSASFSSFESREVVKLKLDLINYQMETAKLERQRVLDQIKADALERESRAIESALRIRRARLLAADAESRLPPAHPARLYTMDEAPILSREGLILSREGPILSREGPILSREGPFT